MLIDELIEKREEYLEAQQGFELELRLCTSLSCAAAGSGDLLSTIEAKLAERGLAERVVVRSVGCLGLCSAGPLLSLFSRSAKNAAAAPTDVPLLLHHLQIDDAEVIVASVAAELSSSGRSFSGDSPFPDAISADTSQPFFTRQHKLVLANIGQISPLEIEAAIAVGGYETLLTAIMESPPESIIEKIRDSGLRGRGGAGYPTGLKWSTVARAKSNKKYIICNGDEGDPGAFMDRSILEGDPHLVLEGMALAAYAVGADEGFLYVRAEYPLAIERLRKAIRQAESIGLLGRNISGTDFSFNVSLRLGAGAYVCGEETALMASIEGGRGIPRVRPPWPAERGVDGHPTLINNVETFANIVPILRGGVENYISIGTERSRGTKVFALAGQIRNIGLIEVPMGISLREIIYDIGGGMVDGRSYKAVQTGGPSGGCLPAELLDMAVDYDSLREAGSIMGSGGMIVMDESSSMVDVARYFMEFSRSESCGKCTPCRVGTAQMHQLLDRIARGCADYRDLERVEELCELLPAASLCGLGKSAPNPVRSTLRYFRHEYLEKISGEAQR